MDNNTAGQPNGTLVLILGIAGIICLPILAPIAWIMGNNGMALLNSGQGDETQRGNVNAGRICGIIGTVLMIVGAVVGMLFGGAIMAAVGADAARGMR